MRNGICSIICLVFTSTFAGCIKFDVDPADNKRIYTTVGSPGFDQIQNDLRNELQRELNFALPVGIDLIVHGNGGGADPQFGYYYWIMRCNKDAIVKPPKNSMHTRGDSS